MYSIDVCGFGVLGLVEPEDIATIDIKISASSDASDYKLNKECEGRIWEQVRGRKEY